MTPLDDLPRLVSIECDSKLTLATLGLPPRTREGLLAYIRWGIPPGSFLQALLSNDLLEACRRADPDNRAHLFDFVFVLDNYAPMGAYGSRAHVRAWIERSALLRRQTMEANA